MQANIGKFFMALAALVMAANIGTAYAGPQGGYAQQQDPPKDCRKDPNDPRCKK
jgi:hypothetical protein